MDDFPNHEIWNLSCSYLGYFLNKFLVIIAPLYYIVVLNYDFHRSSKYKACRFSQQYV